MCINFVLIDNYIGMLFLIPIMRAMNSSPGIVIGGVIILFYGEIIPSHVL